MSETMIKVRLVGGDFDGRIWQVEPVSDRGSRPVPPAGLHMPVIGSDGIVTEIYERGGRDPDGDVPIYIFRGVLPSPSRDGESGPEPLDPELAAYLDWPLYFPDDSVSCSQGNCPGCKAHPEWDESYIASARRMTVRKFLADVKKHAEEKQ